MLITNKKYSDIPFFISKNNFTGDLNLTLELNAVRQSLKNLLLTNSGERRFDYNFGANMYNYLFESLTVDLKLEIQARIASVIKIYEPRVILNDILVTDDPKINALNILIDFGLIGTQVTDKLTISLIRTR